jgi:protein-tyrosine phosphatase
MCSAPGYWACAGAESAPQCDHDLVVVLDRGQERILRNWAPADRDRAKVRLLLSFDAEQAALCDVPDPYYSGDALFDSVLGMIESANHALLKQLAPAIRQGVQ